MTEIADSKFCRLAQHSVGARAGLITVALLILFVIAAPFARVFGGPTGFASLVYSFAACLFTDLLSVVACGLIKHGEMVYLRRFGVGMSIRMAMLLLICGFVGANAPDLMSSGFLLWLLLFYLFGLAIDTATLVCAIPSSNTKKAS